MTEVLTKKSTLRHVCLEGHANSFALNKDNNSIAVAGRSLLKIYTIDANSFIEVHNMRKPNLSFSSNAIAWSHIDNNILATAATNGCIAVWDLNKFGRQKQVNVYHDHERTTHAVSFHNTDPNFLLSASQDSTIKLFDLREKSQSVSTFSSSESVRDVKFNPINCNSFASVSENGCVQLWDVRKSEKFVQQFTAHSGPIYCLDWHPRLPWLATGSRDKLIKVWNMSTPKPTLEHTIHTIAVVGRVRWRPDRKYHIASCALVVDYSIYIWDIRRPFIPYASFNEHTNVTTDIAFKGSPDVLLSTSKDSTIYQHATQDAHHQTTNPQCATINPRGEILYVCKSKQKAQPIMTTSSSSLKLGQIIPIAKKIITTDAVDSISVDGTVPNEDEFHLTKSTLHFFTDNSKHDDVALTKTLHKDFQFFIACAEEYKLKSSNFQEFLDVLDHNAQVARKYGRPNVSMLWNLVKMVYKTLPIRPKTVNNFTSQASNQSSSNVSGITRGGSFGTAGLVNNSNSKIGSRENISNDENLAEEIGSLSIAKMTTSDFEVEVYDESNSNHEIDSKNLRNGFLFTGPHDSYVKDFPMCSSSLINNELMHQHYRNSQLETRELIECSPPPDHMPQLTISVCSEDYVQLWKPFQVLADNLVLQSEVGDVQTPTCILLCLNSVGGTKNLSEDLLIDSAIQENFLQAYIDMLHRHQLWNKATEVINMASSWSQFVGEMNEQSTTIHTSCGECGRVIQKGSYCRHCKSHDSSRCAICFEIVRGAFTFCNICCHGGHLQHVIDWFSHNPKCPRCNHLCEYD